ncbi:hypothetical protein LDBPK_150490, partial [Leishmania donovani]
MIPTCSNHRPARVCGHTHELLLQKDEAERSHSSEVDDEDTNPLRAEIQAPRKRQHGPTKQEESLEADEARSSATSTRSSTSSPLTTTYHRTRHNRAHRTPPSPCISVKYEGPASSTPKQQTIGHHPIRQLTRRVGPAPVATAAESTATVTRIRPSEQSLGHRELNSAHTLADTIDDSLSAATTAAEHTHTTILRQHLRRERYYHHKLHAESHHLNHVPMRFIGTPVDEAERALE